MTTYPPIAIGIITYNRLDCLIAVLRSLHENVIYPNLKWVLSDDGSPEDYVQEVQAALPYIKFDRILRHDRRGMGFNWNQMIAACETLAPMSFLNQDDWLLTEPLDLRLGALFLQHNPDYGMLRYHKLTGHTGLVSVVKEWDTFGAIKDYHHSDNEYVPRMMPFMELLPPFSDSDTFSPYSGGVHLRTRTFTNHYGVYSEGRGFSETEMEYMARINLSLRRYLNTSPRVAMFPHYFESRWRDIGTTYRGTDVEKETIGI